MELSRVYIVGKVLYHITHMYLCMYVLMYCTVYIHIVV